MRWLLANTQDILSASKTPIPQVTETPKQHPKRNAVASSKKQSSPIVPAMPQQAKLSISQSYKISSRSDAPVETEVVVQTDTIFPSLKLIMQCDGPLIDAHPTIGGANALGQMGVSWGVLPDHPNVVVYSYNSSAPPFGPANPLVIDIWSKDKVTCKQVATF